MEGYKNNNNSQPANMPKGARLGFGIFMILFYIGIGTLFILDIFNIDNQGISLSVGILLVVYGIWRGIRLFKGWN